MVKQFKPKADTLEYINLRPNWNYFCLDCSIRISRRASRCASCRCKLRVGKLNPNYGKKHKGLNAGRNNPMFGKPTPHGKWIRYRGINFKSSYEVALAKYLFNNKIKWRYEYKTFDLVNCTYTPDFYLPKTDEYIEVKGYWRDDAKSKYLKFRRKFKFIKISVLNQKKLKNLGII